MPWLVEWNVLIVHAFRAPRRAEVGSAFPDTCRLHRMEVDTSMKVKDS
jgi:hypothetical protein